MPLSFGLDEKSIYAPSGEFIFGRERSITPDKPPGAGDIIAAAFSRENILAPLFVDDSFSHDDTFNDPNFNPIDLEEPDRPWDDATNPFKYLRGYEDNINLFIGARSISEIISIQKEVDRERENIQVLSEGGLGAIGAVMAASILDPLILIPGAGIVKGAQGIKVAASARRSAVFAASAVATQETILQHQQQTRTFKESAFNIGAASVIGGVLGGAVSGLGKAKYNNLKGRVQNYIELADDFDSAAPAGSVAEARAILSEVDAPKVAPAFGFERVASWVNQRVRPFLSDNVVARKTANLLERAGVKLEGGEKALDAETFLDIQRARTELAIESGEQIFLEAAQSSGKNVRQKVFGINDGPSIDGLGNIDDFWQAVAVRLRGGEAVNEVVENTAKVMRDNITDPILNRAIELGFVDDALRKESDRYLTTMWDPERLRDPSARAELMENLVEDGRRAFTERASLDIGPEGQPLKAFDETAFRERMGEWMDQRLRTPMSRNLPSESLPGNSTRSIFMERSLDFIEDYNRYSKWLVNDPRVLLRRYSRSGWSEIGIAERFGLVTVRNEIRNISTEFLPKIRGAAAKDALTLTRQMNDKIRALVDDSDLLTDALENGLFDVGARMTDGVQELTTLLRGAETDAIAEGILRTQQQTLIRQLSTGDMALALDQVATAYKGLDPGGTVSVRQQRKFTRERDRTTQALKNARDFVRGTLDLPQDPTAILPRVALGARKAVHTMLGGSIGLSSIPDVGLLIGNFGFERVYGTMFDVYVKNLSRLKLRKGQAELLLGPSLVVNDSVTQSRIAMGLDDLASSSAPTRTERALENLVRFTNYTSLATPWNQTIRDLIVFTTQSMMDDLAVKVANGKVISKADLNRMKELGLNRDSLSRIGQQFQKHAEKFEGKQDIMSPNLAAWDDPIAIAAFRKAIAIADDITLLKGSPLDRPALNWMAPEVKGLIFQFMSFNLSATSRITTRGLQSMRAGDLQVLNGFAMMTGLGALSVYLKSVAKGTKQPETTGEWIAAGVQQSGVLGILERVDGMAVQATAGKVGVSPLFGKSRFYSPDTMISALFGPVAAKTSELAQGVVGFADLDPEPKDIERLRRTMFLQNHWALSRIFDRASDAIQKSVED